VRKATGEEYIFRTLSELQRAIAQRRVLITDSLSRDGSTFRPLNQLTELDSFFAAPSPGQAVAAESVHSSPNKGWGKRPGETAPRADAPAPGTAQPPSAQIPLQAPPVAAASSNTSMLDEHTPRGGFTTNPPGVPAAVPRPNSARPIQAPRGILTRHGEPKPLSPNATALSAVQTPVVGPPNSPPATPSVASPLSAPAAAGVFPTGEFQYAPTSESERMSSGPPADDRPTPNRALPRRRRLLRNGGEDNAVGDGNRFPSAPHLLESLTAPPRRRFGGPRWILAVVLLGGGVLVAATVGRDYFASFSQDSKSGVVDPRVASFLSAGDDAFAAGDLEEARAQYEKASALSESVDVVQRLLTVEVFRVDADWLQLKIIPTDSAERPPIEATFRERCAKIQGRVSQLQKLGAGAPSSAAATLALIDALRVLGQVQAARALVERSHGLGDEPREAYVSAMLDVSEPNPNWDAVIARLKGAAAAERGVARGQAALVYALISSKDFVQAQQELEVLRSRRRPYPATPVLERFLSSSQLTEPRASTVNDSAPTTAVSETQTRAGESREVGVGRAIDAMSAAAEARAAGELARAARLYSQALSQEPGNVAAMTGLGDVARSQGNTDIALSHYGAALRANPNYAPAVLACADLKWSLGDRSGAVELYRRLGDGPSRVRDRVVEFEKATAKAAEANASVSTGTPIAEPVEPSNPVPSELPPKILPESVQPESSPPQPSSASDEPASNSVVPPVPQEQLPGDIELK
jgi:lipoprotein NlpI